MLRSRTSQKEAYSLLKEGVVKGLSIGYSPTRYRLDPDSGVRLLESVEFMGSIASHIPRQ